MVPSALNPNPYAGSNLNLTSHSPKKNQRRRKNTFQSKLEENPNEEHRIFKPPLSPHFQTAADTPQRGKLGRYDSVGKECAAPQIFAKSKE